MKRMKLISFSICVFLFLITNIVKIYLYCIYYSDVVYFTHSYIHRNLCLHILALEKDEIFFFIHLFKL